MNLELLKKSLNQRVQLQPPARRSIEHGTGYEPIDDDWIIQDVSDAGVRVSNIRTGHVTTLGKDHIHHYTSNPDRSQAGRTFGFLTLNVQVFISGNKLWVKPNPGPGKPVEDEKTSTILPLQGQGGRAVHAASRSKVIVKNEGEFRAGRGGTGGRGGDAIQVDEGVTLVIDNRPGGVIAGGDAGGAPARSAKVPRNDPCPCGSGTKYKHCHGKAV